MALLSIDDPGRDWRGARVLLRSDLNVPLDGGTVTDDTRIQASLPTIRALLSAGAGVAVCSHLGRPKGERVPELSLEPVAERLGKLLSRRVELLPDCIGQDVAARARSLEGGELVVLENLRYHSGEEANDPEFASALANGYSDYVNDAFGAAHRAHASVVGVAERLPARAGLLLAREVEQISRLTAKPSRPFVAVLGGAKVSDKLPLIEALLEKTDRILVGGAMCFTFIVAMGDEVGASLHEGPEVQELARELMRKAVNLNCAIQLPVDVVVADKFEAGASLQVVPSDAVPDGWMGVDVGPRTAAEFAEVIEEAATVFWNGPMGAFEIPGFADGTRAVAEALARADGVTLAGGGDSAAALSAVGVAPDALTHVSTGGGAALEMIEGKVLPGVAALPEA
jgi:3-phosphoglycerate kinase